MCLFCTPFNYYMFGYINIYKGRKEKQNIKNKKIKNINQTKTLNTPFFFNCLPSVYIRSVIFI